MKSKINYKNIQLVSTGRLIEELSVERCTLPLLLTAVYRNECRRNIKALVAELRVRRDRLQAQVKSLSKVLFPKVVS